jgi:hypothetical protein
MHLPSTGGLGGVQLVGWITGRFTRSDSFFYLIHEMQVPTAAAQKASPLATKC